MTNPSGYRSSSAAVARLAEQDRQNRYRLLAMSLLPPAAILFAALAVLNNLPVN
jgi:hypothetical protein